MNKLNILGWCLALPLACGASAGIAADGVIRTGCNCNRGGGMTLSPMPMADSAIPNYMPPAMSAMPMLPSDPMPMGPAAGIPNIPEQVAPPPGTLGRTYSLPTRLLPAEKHPRVGMLDVRATAEDVIVSDMNEFREEDDVKGFQDEERASLWHFETKPLLSGVPHIYKVELINGGVTTDVRYVRLVRGRIIELAF